MSQETVDSPIKLNQVYEVEANRLNDDGDGVASINGFTVFVPFLLPGERAKVRVTERQKRFGRAKVVERLSTSPSRQDAPCPVFGECGGCQVQHLSYDGQLQWKESRIQRVATNLGLDMAVVKSIIPSDEPFRYRNQVQIPVQFGEASGTLDMGFYGMQSHDIVPTDSCHLQSESMQLTLDKARKFLTSLGAEKASSVHHMIVRESAVEGQQMVVFAVSRSDDDLQAALRRFHAPNVVSVAMTVQPKVGGPVWGRTTQVLKGSEAMLERIGGVEFRVSPRSFLQVNPSVAERLYETVLSYADLSAEDTVIDAYCGIGTLTLMMAKAAKQAIGIEEVDASVEDARHNADVNGIQNAEFLVRRVEHWLPRFAASGDTVDVVVFDPPRKGVDPAAIQSVIDAKPQRIVYASCNPATLQRDLKLLIAGGYQVKAMQPFDMFPQTAHVECVVSTRRVDK